MQRADVRSAFLGHDAGSATKYISPSDALMSPCTAKLGLLKGKKFDRVTGGGGGFGGGREDSGVKRLFGGRVVVRGEDQGMKDKDVEVNKEENKNEDVEMEMEKN